jgi:extracellular matrix protein 14
MVNRILERFDLVFIPVVNPDGYEYTWEVDRLWRKSRQRTKMSYCPGFDLDHSFSYRWDSVEHQTEPCSESYGGDEPFQAVEAAQLADWAKNETDNGSKFVGYLDLHSYSQQVLVPYSFSCNVQPPNMENLEEVAMNLAKHMRLSNGELYTVASACEGAVTPPTDWAGPLVEARGGSAIDYVYHELGAHYSYQIKLRDTGSYGFLLPSDNIIPTGEEVFQAMKYLGDYCEQHLPLFFSQLFQHTSCSSEFLYAKSSMPRNLLKTWLKTRLLTCSGKCLGIMAMNGRRKPPRSMSKQDKSRLPRTMRRQ